MFEECFSLNLLGSIRMGPFRRRLVLLVHATAGKTTNSPPVSEGLNAIPVWQAGSMGCLPRKPVAMTTPNATDLRNKTGGKNRRLTVAPTQDRR